MRGAGCTINDMWDSKIDKAVGPSFFHPSDAENRFLIPYIHASIYRDRAN